MDEYSLKIDSFMFDTIKEIKSPKVLEFGVKEGRSTKMFLDLCKSNDGKLISVDINDYRDLFKDSNWNFIQCRDDNFEKLDSYLKDKLDVIYLDSLHEAKHVEKIIYHYFSKLKIGGFFFIDDISWLPYTKNSQRNNFYCEINNKETFDKLLDIYNNNQRNIDIYFSFISSGMCKIIKKNEKLEVPSKILTRDKSLKNLIRKIKKFQ
jgi:predicted O-methyltransferase YrrM